MHTNLLNAVFSLFPNFLGQEKNKWGLFLYDDSAATRGGEERPTAILLFFLAPVHLCECP